MCCDSKEIDGLNVNWGAQDACIGNRGKDKRASHFNLGGGGMLNHLATKIIQRTLEEGLYHNKEKKIKLWFKSLSLREVDQPKRGLTSSHYSLNLVSDCFERYQKIIV